MNCEFSCTKILDGMKLSPKPCQVTVSQTGPGACKDSMMLESQGAREGEQGHQGALQGLVHRPDSLHNPLSLRKTAIAEKRTGIGCGSYDKRDAEERASSPRESLRPSALAWLSGHCSSAGGHQPCDGTTSKPREPLWIALASWKQATDPLRRPRGSLYLKRPGAQGRATTRQAASSAQRTRPLAPKGLRAHSPSPAKRPLGGVVHPCARGVICVSR